MQEIELLHNIREALNNVWETVSMVELRQPISDADVVSARHEKEYIRDELLPKLDVVLDLYGGFPVSVEKEWAKKQLLQFIPLLLTDVEAFSSEPDRFSNEIKVVGGLNHLKILLEKL